MQYPSVGHEVLTSVLLYVKSNAKDPVTGRPLFTDQADANQNTLFLGGSTDVEMVDGSRKSPDGSIYEDFPKFSQAGGWPTVVWEVAYSQHEKDLAYVLGRYVTCTAGKVRLAIGVKIKLDPDVPVEEPQIMQKVTCTFWEVEETQEFATLEESGLELDCLTRSDEFAAEEHERVVPAASKFSCVSQIQGTYVKFIGSPSAVYNVSFHLEYLSGDDLCLGA